MWPTWAVEVYFGLTRVVLPGFTSQSQAKATALFLEAIRPDVHLTEVREVTHADQD